MTGTGAMTSNHQRDTARMVALADVYVITNRVRDLLEDRLEAIQRALANGATAAEVTKALAGAA
jgi:hypothetical protein